MIKLEFELALALAFAYDVRSPRMTLVRRHTCEDTSENDGLLAFLAYIPIDSLTGRRGSLHGVQTCMVCSSDAESTVCVLVGCVSCFFSCKDSRTNFMLCECVSCAIHVAQ
jgi:hypothetical protein